MAKTINGNTARRNTMMTMMMMKGRRNVSMGDKCLEPERIVDRQDRQTRQTDRRSSPWKETQVKEVVQGHSMHALD